MPSLKPRKSVAHNLAHHFASTLNYWEGDYAINHLAEAAKRCQEPLIVIDVLAQSANPPIVQTGVVAEFIPQLKDTLHQLLIKEGFSIDVVASAALQYNFNVQRVDLLFHQPTYDCISSLKTTDGRTYEAHLTEKNN